MIVRSLEASFDLMKFDGNIELELPLKMDPPFELAVQPVWDSVTPRYPQGTDETALDEEGFYNLGTGGHSSKKSCEERFNRRTVWIRRGTYSERRNELS
jgi:hypothetical protein